jgi:hypothetical protein
MKTKIEVWVTTINGEPNLFMNYTNRKWKEKRYEGTKKVIETAQRMYVNKKMWAVWELAKHLDSLKTK